MEARLELEKGFVDVFKNDETGKTAFAWIINEERVYGADNTGGWHKHPIKDSKRHESCEAFDIRQFIKKLCSALR